MKAIKLLILCSLIAIELNAQPDLQQLFNGRYRLYTEDHTIWRNQSFWEHLRPFDKDTCVVSHKSHTLEIAVLDKKKIRFSELGDSCVERSKVVRYKRDGSMIIIPKCRNRRFYGIPPFFFFTNTERLTLISCEDKDLRLDYKGRAWGMVFFLAAGYDKEGTQIYRHK